MDDYYPFGLTFNSWKRGNSVHNRWKFQSQEHIDELDLGWDAFKWRNHMPDIGRFFGVDPLAEKYLYNSPYAFSENKVVAHAELEGLEAISIQIRTVDTRNRKEFSSGGLSPSSSLRFNLDLSNNQVKLINQEKKMSVLKFKSKNENGSVYYQES